MGSTETGHLEEVFSTTMLRLSLSGSMRRNDSESSLCNQELVSLKFSRDFAELPNTLKLCASLLTMIILVTTSCPTNLGTAMRGSVHINLPKLMKDKATFNAVADEYEVQIRGIHGEHTETDDGVFDISNKRRLGKSEKQLVQDMISGVKALMEAEAAL